MTSVTTLLALLSLFFLGGEVIRDFAFAMIWGVIIGTYSSVWIASATLLWMGGAPERNGRPSRRCRSRAARSATDDRH